MTISTRQLIGLEITAVAVLAGSAFYIPAIVFWASGFAFGWALCFQLLIWERNGKLGQKCDATGANK